MSTIIGLGTNCQAASQIRRRFNSPAYPFDWLIVSPEAIVELIETDFDWNFENLYFDASQPAVMSSEPWVTFLHDFRLDENFREDEAKIHAKFAHLANRFIRTLESGDEVVFVCHEMMIDAFTPVMAAIDSRFPDLDYRVLLTRSRPLLKPGETLRPQDPRVQFAIVDLGPPGEDAWRGDNKSWDIAFEQMGLPPRIDPPAN